MGRFSIKKTGKDGDSVSTSRFSITKDSVQKKENVSAGKKEVNKKAEKKSSASFFSSLPAYQRALSAYTTPKISTNVLSLPIASKTTTSQNIGTGALKAELADRRASGNFTMPGSHESRVKELEAHSDTVRNQLQEQFQPLDYKGAQIGKQDTTAAQLLNSSLSALAQEAAQESFLADLDRLSTRTTGRPGNISLEDFFAKSKYVPTGSGEDAVYNPVGNTYSDTGFDDIRYDYINKNKDAEEILRNIELSSGASPLGLGSDFLTQMGDTEVGIFNYLYATQGPDAAYSYIDEIKSSLTARNRAAEEALWRGMVRESPSGTAGMSAFSVLTSPAKGLSYIGQLADYAADGTIDQNAGTNRLSYINSAIRSEASDIVETNWGAPGSFLYNTGMSMADFLYAAALSGGFGAAPGTAAAKASSGLALAIMGTGAAADTVIASKDRGLSDDQAFALGTIAGLAEVATEKFSLDALLKDPKNAVLFVLQNAGVEASEETASSLINFFADIAISKDKSEWQTSINDYISQGYSENEAFGKAFADQAKSIGLDALGGALSGGVLSGARVGANAVYNRASGTKTVDAGTPIIQNQDTTDPEVQQDWTFGPDSDLVSETNRLLDQPARDPESEIEWTFGPESQLVQETNRLIDQPYKKPSSAIDWTFGPDSDLVQRANQLLDQPREDYIDEGWTFGPDSELVQDVNRLYTSRYGERQDISGVDWTFGADSPLIKMANGEWVDANDVGILRDLAEEMAAEEARTIFPTVEERLRPEPQKTATATEQTQQETSSDQSWRKYTGAPRANGTNPAAQARTAARQAAENADLSSMNTAERESFLQAYDMGRSGESFESDVSALPVQSEAVYGAFFQGQDDYFSGSADRYAAYRTAENSRTEGPVVDTRKGTQPVDLPVAGQKNTASIAETGTHRMTMEDFTEVNSPVWNNVEYGDTETQSQITRQTHQAMVEEGAVVTVPEGTMEQVGQSYPDLRGMKKAERTPILRQKMKELKASLRQFLNSLKGGTYEFEVNGNILEAKLYDTGVREVLEKIDQSKASMLYHSDQVFQNARYLYSTPDYDGNPNVYRWNYFYTPVQIGDEIVGVRIAVRDMAHGQNNLPESQIYNWGIKKSDAALGGGKLGTSAASPGTSSAASLGAALDGGGGGNAASHTNVSSATPVESSIPQSRSVVNGTSSIIWQKNEGASKADTQTRSGAATLPVPPETTPTDLPVVDQAAPSTPSKKKGIQIPIDERTWQDAGNRKVNAFQYDNPELHPYFVEAAKALRYDLASAVKGERIPVYDSSSETGKDLIGFTGTKRSVTEPIAQALDNANLSYAQIEKALSDLIADNGQENYAAAKKVELVLDDMLVNGYTDSDGQDVPPNQEYIAARDAASGAAQDSTEYRMSEEEWESLMEQEPESAVTMPAGEQVTAESSVGAAAYGFDPYTNLQGRYGTLPEGENPSRIVDVPAKTSDKSKVSLTARTVMEAAATPDSALPDIAQLVVDGRLSYMPINNNQRTVMAESKIRSIGYEDALANWRSDVRAGKSSADLVAMGAQLYNATVNAGDTKAAMDILYDYTRLIRSGAQATQAARILKTLTPSGTLYMIQKEVNNLNEAQSGKKKRKVTSADNVPVELWMQRVGENLADELSRRINAPQDQVQTVAQTILSDLRRFASETAPKQIKAGKKRTEMDRIMDLFQNKTAYQEAWDAAKATVSDTFENDPDALAAFDSWLDQSLDYAKALTKELTKQSEIVISEELADAYLSAETEEARAKALDAIYQNVADQIPSTFVDKWNAWRYLAMLGNPRTHIRNMVGNAGFVFVRFTKDRIAAVIESGVSAASGGKLKRTKSFAYTPKLYAAAWQDFDNVSDVLSGNKYDDVSSIINDKRTIFKFKPLEAARQGNSNLLSAEDMVFKRVSYAGALAGYLNANGVTAEQLRAGNVDSGLLDAARNYAGQEALKATFNDRNAFSDAVVKAAKSIPVFGEAVLPFKRTPANILARGFEYSPLGLAKGLTYDLIQVKNGNMTGAEAIDNIAKGMTGSALLALGGLMAAAGVVTGGAGDDDKQAALNDLTGGQTYALNLPGGVSVTLDWLAPEALPFFMGVQAMESFGEEGLTGDTIASAFASISEPMLEMSMLQSLNDLIDNVSYAASNEKITGLVGSALISYLTQAIPTIGGQIERTSEDKRYSTYTNKDSILPTDVQYALGKASARIPGWDFQQIPYIDAWGREEATGLLPVRAFNNFLNPAYTSYTNVTPVDEEIQRLYSQLGDGGVVPSRADKSFIVDKETVYLSGDQYVEYATKKGQTAYNLLEELIQTSAYQSMSDADKAETVKDIYEYANAVGKAAVSAYKPDGWVGKALNSGVPADDYVLYRATADQDGNGTVTQGESAAALLPIRSLTDQQKGKVWQSQNSSWNEAKNPFTGALVNAGIAPETAADILSRYSEIDNASYQGDSVPRQKQTALSQYLDGLGLTAQQRAVVDDTYKFYTMFPADPIPYSIETMSDAAQKRWPAAQAWGMSEEEFLKYYPIRAQSGTGITKEVKLRQLQEAGMTAQQANDFWDITK